jgi:hypothetical protein
MLNISEDIGKEEKINLRREQPWMFTKEDDDAMMEETKNDTELSTTDMKETKTANEDAKTETEETKDDAEK